MIDKMTESNRLTDLVQQLREYAENMYVDFCSEAADAIEAQAKRIEELEAVLQPFADEVQFFWPKALDKHLAAPPQLYLTIGEFRAARKVLGEKE
jgi:hypothetical protein